MFVDTVSVLCLRCLLNLNLKIENKNATASWVKAAGRDENLN